MQPRFSAGIFLALAVACGGKAIIDGANAGGGGGVGGSGQGNTGQGAQGNTGLICSTDPPVGALTICEGTGSGAMGPQQCVTGVCDEAGHEWMSECQGNGCRCYYDLGLRCSCVIQGGLACSPGVPSCCPAPFPP
jgi:hypothetical protein